MADSAYNTQLAEAKKSFDAGKYSDCERILKGMPQEDLKVKHNLVAVQYLQREVDGEGAIAELGSELGSDKSMCLLYEGHETALYNRAALHARGGQTAEAASLLRALLEMSGDISLTVLTHALCLFHTLTRAAPKLGSRPRSKPDEDLIHRILNEKMSDITKEPSLLKLVTAAFADSGNLHEVFKDAAENSVEQAIYLNSLGVLSLSDGKANVGTLCFVKALKVAAQQPNAHLLQQPVTYNAGLCALLREDYEEAVRHFLAVQDAMRASPLYWARFAEAAVGSVQRQQRIRQREDYERQQSGFSALLQTGKVYANFEFMLLPGAVTSPGPVQEPLKDNAMTVAVDLLAATAIQNALFLLIPVGRSLSSALDEFPQREAMLQYTVLYWVALELMRKNYLTAAEVGQDLLSTHDRHPLPPTVHAALLSYIVEALIHLNDPDRAMKILRRASLSTLLAGASSTDSSDAAQRSRVEALFVNLAVTHVLTGSWNQAHSVLDSFLTKLYEMAPAGSVDYKPEKDVMFAYQMLAVFLELAQGNSSKAADWLGKIHWNV